MNKLLIEAPLNSLSFGNVTYNILREFSKRDIEVGYFPIGNIDIAAFESSEEFKTWLQKAVDRRWDILASNSPSLKLWHLNGGENRKSSQQNLLTFHECSEPTNVEISVCKSQNKTLFSSNYSRELFEQRGCSNVQSVPMGFDTDLHNTGRKYLENVTHFGLMGKFEKRKHTAKIIQCWLKKFGNDNRYQLTCCITNPFFKPEQMQAIITDVLGGKRYTNINFLPYLEKNSEVNELLNAIDIDLTGLSLAEGWNLPAFNATCLGKWSIVGNHTAHKDWANEDNCILLEPEGTVDCHDGHFFVKGSDYNQGQFFNYSDESIILAMEKAVKKLSSSPVNQNGLNLKTQFSYSKTVDSIIKSFE